MGASKRAAGRELNAGDFSDWVRRLRTELGLSQRAFARRVGCNESTVIGWECWGRRPYPALAAVLKRVGEEVGIAPWEGE